MRPALRKARIAEAFRPWHNHRHTAVTYEAAVGNPQAFIQLKAGHSQGTITERYIRAWALDERTGVRLDEPPALRHFERQ